MQDGTPSFRERYKNALQRSLCMLLITCTLYLVTLIAAQFTESLATLYLVSLLGVNTLVIQFTYLYGINPQIIKMQLIKLSNLIGVRPSDILDSDQTRTATQTAFDAVTGMPTNVVVPSKLSEQLRSRDVNDILSQLKKSGQQVNSEKLKETGMVTYDQPRSQHVNIN